MMALDEDALICDFAETYHIFNMYQLPVLYVATLAIGLRNDSRIKTKLCGLEVDYKTLLLAHIVDNTAINVWMKTEDAQHGRNRPKSMVESLTTKTDQSKMLQTFESGEDFEKKWRLLNGC